MLPPIPAVLTFASSDPSSGAGLQADLMTFSAVGCHGVSVVTGITAQDSVGVQAWKAMSADWVKQQAQVLLTDIPVAAFKIGVVGSAENALAIAQILRNYPDIPVVLDPVLSSGRGDAFANHELIVAIKKHLLPLTTVLTPNSVELQRLAAEADLHSLESQAQALLANGCGYVLVTGGHEAGECVANRLFACKEKKASDLASICAAYEVQRHQTPRLPGQYHGSGCTFASALAAFLAHGKSVANAAALAQQYTFQTLKHALTLGRGQQIPNRFFALAQPGAE